MAQEVIDQVRVAAEGKKVMVTLDSGHHAAHVIKEMEAYCPMVSVGSYCIVEVSLFCNIFLCACPLNCLKSCPLFGLWCSSGHKDVPMALYGAPSGCQIVSY